MVSAGVNDSASDPEKIVSISTNVVNLLRARADMLLFQEVSSRNGREYERKFTAAIQKLTRFPEDLS